MLKNSEIPRHLGIHIISDGSELLLDLREAISKAEDKLCDFNTAFAPDQTTLKQTCMK